MLAFHRPKMHYSVICFVLLLALVTRSCFAAPTDKKTDRKRDRMPKLTDDEYTRLLEILARPVSQRARTKEDNRLYCTAKRRHINRKRVADPYRGVELDRLTIRGLILLPPAEIDACLAFFHTHTLKDGRDKLWDMIRKMYFGISKDKIMQWLHRSETHFQMNLSFQNKALLQPVIASRVNERHQIDLVDLISIAGNQTGTDGYVLSVLDCFSRFLWMRSVPDKKPSTIARKLDEIYTEFDPPQILQSDQGTEFHGEVDKLCRRWNIKIIWSRPRHPESQGKIEWSHVTWKKQLRSLVHGLLEDAELAGKNWTQALPYITKKYNCGLHASIKMSPFECMFGTWSNVLRNFHAGGLCPEIEENQDILEEDSTLLQNDTSEDTIPPPYKQRKLEMFNLLTNASKTDKTQRERMAERCVENHSTNSYDKGEIVLVQCEGHDKGVKRGDLSLSNPRVCQAIVREQKDNMYTVMIISPERRGELMKICVDKITSLTSKEEHAKQKNKFTPEISRENNKRLLNTLRNLASFQSEIRPLGTTGIDALLENSIIHGLQLDSDNSGDGNCLFLALQQQLEKHGVSKTHREIRREIVKFLTENIILGEGGDAVYLPDFVPGYPSWETYLQHLSEDGVWGDNIVLIAAANLYHISICVISSVQDSEPLIIEASDGVSQFDVYLGHISEVHYVTLQPQRTLCELCGFLAKNSSCHCNHNFLQKDTQAHYSINNLQQDTFYGDSGGCDDGDDDNVSLGNNLPIVIDRENCVPEQQHKKVPERPVCSCFADEPTLTQMHSLENLCDHLLIYIFALAAMHSFETINNISLVCKRFYSLVNTQDCKDKMFQVWLKRVTDSSTKDKTFKELYSRKSAIQYTICKYCHREFPCRSGYYCYPMGTYAFYDTDDEFCTEECKCHSEGTSWKE